MAHDLVEEIRVSGRELIDRVQELLQEGSIRRMVIINGKGETVFEIPLALGVIGMGGAFALAPIISSIAAFAFLVKDTRIVVERYPHSGKGRVRNELSIKNRRRADRNQNHSARDSFEIDAEFEVLDSQD